MTLVGHIVDGILLLAVTAGAWLKAWRIKQDPTANWSEGLIRFVTLGETRTRSEWVTRLRVACGAVGALTLVIAVLLLVSA